MREHTDKRQSRSGTLRSPGPDRREIDQKWELWNLQTLMPDADEAALVAMKQRRSKILAREREALARDS